MSEVQPHYVVICVGTTGDVHPFIRIAITLQSMGRKVTFITNAYHTRLLNGSGLAFVSLGTDEDYLRFIRDPNIWHPQKCFAAVLSQYKDQLMQVNSAISSVAGADPIVVIALPFVVPGAAIARERGLIAKIVSMYLAPSMIRTCHDPLRVGDATMPRWVPMSWRQALWRFIEKTFVDPEGISRINAVRSALNLPAVRASFLTHIQNEPDLTVTLFPPWFGPAMPDWPQPLVYGDFQLFDAEPSDRLSNELSAFLAAGEKPIVFTPGTGNVHASMFFSCALTAVNALGQRAIFLTKERAQLPTNLPATVLWQSYVPFSGLLPHVKALVHHGGIGTTAEALRAGTPQLITSIAWDQFDNGARVAELGRGLVMPYKKLSPRMLTRAIHSLITSEKIRTCCAQGTSHFAQRQDPVALCAEIERRLLGASA